MNIGEIRLVDGAIGRAIKITDTSVIFICMTFPHFRSVRLHDAEKFRKLAPSLDELQMILNVGSGNSWSLTSWKNEINSLSEIVLDEFDDWLESGDNDEFVLNKTSDEALKQIIITSIKDSDWVNDSTAQEKLIQYSIYYLDVLPELINKFIPSGHSHRWQSVRKASAQAHLFTDLYMSIKPKLKNRYRD